MNFNMAIAAWYDKYQQDVIDLADDIWEHPEVGMQEHYACRVTAAFMRRFGFAVTELDAAKKGEEPNCVVARWGSGRPVLGVIGELDALPGLGQDKVPYPSPRPGAGQGCGHNLMAAGGASTAIALKAAMEAEGLEGTVVYLGCPAEETLQGKVYMVHDGLFQGIDACVAWHPMQDMLTASELCCNACSNMDIKFYGKTAHAGGQPENGRSALDAAELTNVGVQYLREHVTDDVRMHYIYTSAGSAPNIVPDFASLNYFVRAKSAANTRDTAERVKKVAEGAAMMTETRVEVIQKAFAYDVLPNDTLNRAMYQAALKTPPLTYTQEELDYATELYRNTNGTEPPSREGLLNVRFSEPTKAWGHSGGTTDVGDVSWLLPTAQLWGGGRVNGCPSHHWTTTATAAHPIGQKTMLYCSKVLAQMCYDMLQDPSIIEEAWKELKGQIQAHGAYVNWLDAK